MKRGTIARFLGVGIGALALGSLAHAVPAPQTPSLAEGPHVRYLAVEWGAHPGTGPALPGETKAQPFRPGSDEGDPQFNTNSLSGSRSAPYQIGKTGTSPGAVVVTSTPQERLERSLRTIAKELR